MKHEHKYKNETCTECPHIKALNQEPTKKCRWWKNNHDWESGYTLNGEWCGRFFDTITTSGYVDIKKVKKCSKCYKIK